MKHIGIAIVVGLLGLAAVDAAPPVEGAWTPRRKKLVDMSWSNPTVDQLAAQVEQMEEDAPLDGITLFLEGRMTVGGETKPVYSNHAMTRLKWRYGYFADQVEKLKRIRFRKFTDNFLYTVMVPADVDWFSDRDWEAVCGNYGILARIVREAGLKGIVFDPEEYAKPLWCSYEGHSHSDAVRQARARGRQFGAAVFKECPRIKILSLFLFSYGTYQQGDAMYSTLSHSFFNGVYDVLPPEATMIEGHEYFGYFANTREEFLQLQRDLDRTFLPRVARENYAKYRSQTQLSCPIYLDSCFFKDNPCYRHLLPEVEQCPRLEYVRRNLESALEVSDEYVWFYSEERSFWRRSRHPRALRTWEETCPGINRALRRAADPFAHGRSGRNLLEIPDLDNEPGKWLFWTARKEDGTGGWKDGLAHLTGVEGSGCVYQDLEIEPGRRYLLLAEGRPRTGEVSGEITLEAAFRDGDLKWLPNDATRKTWLDARRRGLWQPMGLVVEAPGKAHVLSFQMGASGLRKDETVEFRLPMLVDLSETGK